MNRNFSSECRIYAVVFLVLCYKTSCTLFVLDMQFNSLGYLWNI